MKDKTSQSIEMDYFCYRETLVSFLSTGRITGLDPAGLSFEGTNSSQRLDGTDAELVDVIHTAGQPLGIHKAVS